MIEFASMEKRAREGEIVVAKEVKLCSCRCGCKHPVVNPSEDRCGYCNEWHDRNDADWEEEE
jgi:hypothetical protein